LLRGAAVSSDAAQRSHGGAEWPVHLLDARKTGQEQNPNDIQDLCHSIAVDAARGVDFEAISAAMADRRHLITWLRRLGLPPASMAYALRA
jgi:hypothetical protein